jgi:hypothetical protein
VQKTLCLVGLLACCLVAGTCFSQSESASSSLCNLQGKVAQGDHISVHVSGVYSNGLEVGTLEDAACPDQTTWVELALRSDHNKKKLKRLLDERGRAYVVFEGELYGPPAPDVKLPDAVRAAYHPGWGHLAAFKTKLVVRIIRDVAVAPPPKS